MNNLRLCVRAYVSAGRTCEAINKKSRPVNWSTIAFTLVTAYTCQSLTGICASILGISACPTACQKTTQNAESHCDWTNGRHSSTCCRSYMQQIHSWLTRNRVVRTATMQTNSACSTVAHAIRFVVSSCKMALNCDLREKNSYAVIVCDRMSM